MSNAHESVVTDREHCSTIILSVAQGVKKMSKALERRAKLRESLILAGERRIATGGLAGLKTRDLARDIGVANGAVYNLVEDMDELILRVGSHTLGRLDAALTAAEAQGPASPRD